MCFFVFICNMTFIFFCVECCMVSYKACRYNKQNDEAYTEMWIYFWITSDLILTCNSLYFDRVNPSIWSYWSLSLSLVYDSDSCIDIHTFLRLSKLIHQFYYHIYLWNSLSCIICICNSQAATAICSPLTYIKIRNTKLPKIIIWNHVLSLCIIP